MALQQPRDYRRMLYRLDRGTKYESIPALVQHMMEETVLDGILELRMVTSNAGQSTGEQPTQLRLPSTFISFRREGREVNAVALYGPRSSRAPPSSSSGRPSGSNPRSSPPAPSDFALEVKKRYASRTTLVWVFAPLVQRLLNEGASTVLFECRSYLAGSDVAREVRAADAAAAAAAAAERESQYHQAQQPQQPQQPLSYQAQNSMYDQYMYQQMSQDAYEQQAGYAGYPNFVAPSAPNPFPDAMYIGGGYSGQYPAFPDSSPVPPSVQTSPTPRSVAQGAPRTRTAPSPPRAEKDDDPAMELLHRRAPFKRMLGYAGKQHDGSTAVYELADEVAAIAFTDGVSGIGMAGVEAMGRIGQGVRRGSPPSAGIGRPL